MTSTSSPPAGKPFVGLAPFAEADAPYFFGRDSDRAVITSNLIAARLTVLYGPSGCGKSSLLDAGVAHDINGVRAPRRLAAGRDPEFVAVSFRDWKDAPKLGLAVRLKETVGRVLGSAVGGPPPDAPLADILRGWAAAFGGTLLVMLDQFEEYFLYHGRKVAPGTFAHELAEALKAPDLRANVLLSIREDALAQLDAFEETVPTILANTLRLDRLDTERGREAILGPIEAYNDQPENAGHRMEVGEGLVDEVLPRVVAGEIQLETAGRGRVTDLKPRDDDERPIEAAYLQLVMDRLWREETAAGSRILRPETYRRLGGADGIVRSHLGLVLARLGSARAVAEEVLTYLVTPSGTKIALDAAYLAGKTGWPEARVESVMRSLADSTFRILRRVEHPGRTRADYEVFHDVLARVVVEDYVPRVRRRKQSRWIAALTAGLILAVCLSAFATLQWREARLQSAAALKAKEAAVKAEWAAVAASKEAKDQAKVATSRHLATLSASERSERLDRSLLLAVESLRTADTLEARDSLQKALQERPGLMSFLRAEEVDVTSVAFSPDGKALAAGYSSDGGGGVVLWDAATRDRRTTEPLPVKEGGVTSVAFSPDGKALAAGCRGVGRGGGVVLWDAATRDRRTTVPLPVKEGAVYSVAFSPDGNAIAAGYSVGGDGGVVLWDAATRERRTTEPLPVKEGYVTSVAFSPDSKALAAGCGHDGVVLWDVATRERRTIEPLPVKEGDVTSVAFSPDGKALAAGYSDVLGDDGGVVLWDAATRDRRTTVPLPVEEGDVTSVAFSPDGKALAAGYKIGGGGDGVVLWDAATRDRRTTVPLLVKEGDTIGVAFSPDGKALAAGYSSDGGGGVVLWDAATRDRRTTVPLPVKEGGVTSVAFSPDGKALAARYSSVGRNGGVVLWDVATRDRRTTEPLPVKEGDVTSVAFSPDGKALAVGYGVFGSEDGGGVVLWDVATRDWRTTEPLPVKEGDVTSVAFSPDGKALAAGCSGVGRGGGVVVLWDAATRDRRTTVPLPVKEGDVIGVAFSPDGKALAAGYHSYYGGDDGVVLWDVAAQERLAEDPLPVKEGDVQSVAFSPDGKALAAGYSVFDGGGVVLWDVATRDRRTTKPLPVKEGEVSDVAFSPDGRALAAGYSVFVDDDGGVVLWDVATRDRRTTEPLPVKEGDVTSVAFSPDGKALAAGYRVGGGGGVVRWDVDLESWMRLAGQIANRNLSRDEWREYFHDEPYRATFPERPVPPEVASKKR